MEIKAKLNKWNLIKFIRSAQQRKSQTKGQTMEWEKISENNATDKGLTTKIYKQLIKLNNKKTTESKNGQKT